MKLRQLYTFYALNIQRLLGNFFFGLKGDCMPVWSIKSIGFLSENQEVMMYLPNKSVFYF